MSTSGFVRSFVVCVAALVTVSCGSSESSEAVAELTLSLTDAPPGVNSVDYVIACESETLRGELEVDPEQDPPIWSTVVGVPAGQCTVTLTARNSNGGVLCQGSSPVTVVAGDTVKVDITLVCDDTGTGAIEIDGRFEGGGTGGSGGSAGTGGSGGSAGTGGSGGSAGTGGSSGMGACTDPIDQTVIKNPSFPAHLSACQSDTTSAEDYANCLQEEADGLTDACALCYGDFAATCVRAECAGGVRPPQNACNQGLNPPDSVCCDCMESNMCLSSFEACAGFQFPVGVGDICAGTIH